MAKGEMEISSFLRMTGNGCQRYRMIPSMHFLGFSLTSVRTTSPANVATASADGADDAVFSHRADSSATENSTVNSQMKQVMQVIITHFIPYQLQTMPPSYPIGTRFIIVVISGRPVILRYGCPLARSLVAEFGLDVLRMPEICFTLRQHQRGESWVLGPNYPFV